MRRSIVDVFLVSIKKINKKRLQWMKKVGKIVNFYNYRWYFGVQDLSWTSGEKKYVYYRLCQKRDNE